MNDDVEDDVQTPISFVRLVDNKHVKEGKSKQKSLVVLLDSGSSHSMIKYKHVRSKKHKFLKNYSTYSTAAGQYSTAYEVKLKFALEEFDRNTTLKHTFDIDESNDEKGIGYDMIIGRDLLVKLGIDIRFTDQTIKWEDMLVPMKAFAPGKDHKSLSNKEIRASIAQIAEPISTREATERVVRILDSNYAKANLDEVAEAATNLTEAERSMLLDLLKEFEDLFDGTLGQWNTAPVEIELKPDAKPVSARWYPVPHINKETFRKELMRLVEIGVLDPVQESEYGTPVFIIPKKEGTVRFITDFRQVNSQIVRKPYPIPRIADTLQQMEGFTYATALDLNMGYYTIRLDPASKDITTIVTEFGKFRYNVLPMGMCVSGDIFQAKVYELLGDIEGVKCYIDDILAVCKGTFADHIGQLRMIFRRLQKAGLKVNASKCSFGLKEIPYLGYIITQQGVKPDPKKVQGIMDIKRPQTVKEVKSLIGLVQYYRDMWQRRSHILSPLTDVSNGKKNQKIQWNNELENAFNEMKRMVSEETFLNYPDWSKKFTVHTDASDKQLGAVISQDNKPIAFFSRRLSKAQRNYTTTEKELLSIVECLKQFKNILFGYEIDVYSDHKNLVYAATISESQRVMRWRMILEEFAPTIHHIPGVDNIVADTLSRLESANVESQPSNTESINKAIKETYANNQSNDSLEGFPLEKLRVQKEQNKELNSRNSKLKKAMGEDESKFIYKTIDNIKLITYKDRIYVPMSLRADTLNWYHYYLNHPGGDRLANTLLQVCYWKGLTNQAKEFVKKCTICQKHKKRRKYGHLPPKNVKDLTPWETVHIDLVGPYTLTAKQSVPGGTTIEKDLHLTCMTMIDPVTGWFEIVEVPYYNIDDIKSKGQQSIDKTSARISQLFNQTWLSRYPRPHKVVFDNGSEFKRDFEPLLVDFDIVPQCTTVENPQANAPVERVHQVIHNMLVTKELDKHLFDYINPWGEFLSSIAWAIRTSYNSSTQATPAQLVFGRDMLFNITKVIDWKLITERKVKQVQKDNNRENSKRIPHEYSVGDRVFRIKRGVKRKLSDKKSTPFTVTKVYTNGTVKLRQGAKSMKLNIRQIEPLYE